MQATPRGMTKITTFLSPLRGSLLFHFLPTAGAVGCILTPLRGSLWPRHFHFLARFKGAIQRLVHQGLPLATLRVGLEHLLGVLARGFGQPGAAEHAGNFLGPLFPGDDMDARPGAAGCGLLFDQIMMVGEGGNLR